MLLFVDPYRSPAQANAVAYPANINCGIYGKEWEVVKTYEKLVNWVSNNGLPDVISLSQELDGVMTGADCLKWLIEYCIKNQCSLPICLIHDATPTEYERMRTFIIGHQRAHIFRSGLKIMVALLLIAGTAQ